MSLKIVLAFESFSQPNREHNLNRPSPVLCEMLHLRRFASDGKGLRWRNTVFALDFFSGLLQVRR